jgi:hypothetical protein
MVSACAVNLVASVADMADLKRLVPGAHLEVIPIGVGADAFVPSTGGAKDEIVFAGGMSCFPTRRC